MIFDNIDFFNVAELTKIENLSGLRINRFPEKVRNSLEIGAPVSYSRGCELRFILEEDCVSLYLMAIDEDGEVLVFFGDYMHAVYKLPHGVVTAIHIKRPELWSNSFSELDENSRFSKDVCRVFMNNKAMVHYCGIDTYGKKVYLPQPEHLPKSSFLAYGSSITHGAGAVSNYNSYIQTLARFLKSQVYNFGMSGACMCEREMAEHIAGHKEWDFVILELGVNMRGKYSADEFRNRAEYTIKTVANRNINKKVIVISIYPNLHTYYEDGNIAEHEREYNKILSEITSDPSFHNVFFIEGKEILTDFSMLTTDLIHPSDGGHTHMGYCLYKKLGDMEKS